MGEYKVSGHASKRSRRSVNNDEIDSTKSPPRNNSQESFSQSNESDNSDSENERRPPKSKIYAKCHICGVYSAKMDSHLKVHSLPYKCLDCKSGFATKEKLKSHYKAKHPNKKPNKCYYCWKIFENMKLLIQHIESNHEQLNNKYECKFCGKPCQDNVAVKVHELVHTKERRHKCKECDKSYVVKSSLIVHMKKHSKKHCFKCDICSKEFVTMGKLKNHKVTHSVDAKSENWLLCPHVKPTYKASNNNFPVFCQTCDGAAVCTFCGYGFASKQMYMAHTHTNFCVKCGIKYFDGQYYKAHEKYHLMEIKLKCEECKYGFDTLVSFALHNSKQHSVPTGKPKALFQCDECAKEFTTNQRRKFHIQKVHKQKLPFKCNEKECKAEFVTQTQLNVHARKHSPIASHFQCNACDKHFSHKKDLNRHVKIHSETEEKRFICSICGISVKSNRNLKLHMDTHSEKSYKCAECNKMFRQKCYLKVHMKIHENVKPYQCKKCEKSFLKQQGLDEHMIVHIGVSSYCCENCGKYFCSAHSLRKHTSHKFCVEEAVS